MPIPLVYFLFITWCLSFLHTSCVLPDAETSCILLVVHFHEFNVVFVGDVVHTFQSGYGSFAGSANNNTKFIWYFKKRWKLTFLRPRCSNNTTKQYFVPGFAWNWNLDSNLVVKTDKINCNKFALKLTENNIKWACFKRSNWKFDG